MIFKPVDQQQRQQKNLIVRIVNLELWIIVWYNWDGFGFSRSFGHIMFQEFDVWGHSLFYLLLHVWIVLYICIFFFCLLLLLLLWCVLYMSLQAALSHAMTLINWLIDWLIDFVTTNETFSSCLVLNSCIESFHDLYCTRIQQQSIHKESYVHRSKKYCKL